MRVDTHVLRIRTQLDVDHDRLTKYEHPQSFEFAGSFPAVNNELFYIPNIAEMPMHGMFTEPTPFANTGVEQPVMQWKQPRTSACPTRNQESDD
jgi:hypothetical protein